ncbi:hypothetical protein PPYR_01469 [Photinus pyralis]|uniref:Uncharacterized protein n=1 Tax=Photinus pyralis TaxID=7054 RepID=A0A5N4B4F1_PHOPY|nr:hypothetical protein PPYR_01469 [Photinus pyralis]
MMLSAAIASDDSVSVMFILADTQQEEHASNADESSSLQTVSNASSARAIHIISDVQLKKPNSRPGDKLEKSDENSFQPISEVFPQDLEVPSNSQSVKATLHKLRWKKKKTYCKFCNESVTNFERHLQRNHAECKEVIEFLSFPKRSQERKTIITLLRNSGHFDEFLRGNVLPVYRGNISKSLEYYPCSHCKGVFAKTYLSRHTRKCVIKGITDGLGRKKHLAKSQTLIACSLQRNSNIQKLRVVEEVFNIMKVDEISLVAKTDVLIAQFGENYLKKHKRQQMATVCSNKIRELARFLIQFREITNNSSCSLMDTLNPVFFDTVIECAKKLGGYDPVTKMYRAPSLSTHIGTSLKQSSEILIRLLLKEDASVKCNDKEKKIKEIKRFKDLINSQWTTEIASLAIKNLNEKKWEKPTILPLTRDILKFKEFLITVANRSVATLRENSNNVKAFKELVEASLALTVLYNRRRIGDVQYATLQNYTSNFSTINQEECISALSESEKVLTKHYKRIVTGGKGSRAVVILFPIQIREYIDLIIDTRNKTNYVPDKNPYLFCCPDSLKWVRADTAIRKFALKAKLEQPQHISSNKLRKQIATVMQILNMNKEETEQFAQFMGHTEKTHNEFYKLPQDVYQTAKISKLLIMMDKGTGKKYKGKSLDEIQIDPDTELAELGNSDSEDEAVPTTKDVLLEENLLSNTSPRKENNIAIESTSKKSGGRGRWSAEQKSVVTQYFKGHIKSKKAPKKEECEKLKKLHGLLKDKDWVQIKTLVYNSYR